MASAHPLEQLPLAALGCDRHHVDPRAHLAAATAVGARAFAEVRVEARPGSLATSTREEDAGAEQGALTLEHRELLVPDRLGIGPGMLEDEVTRAATHALDELPLRSVVLTDREVVLVGAPPEPAVIGMLRERAQQDDQAGVVVRSPGELRVDVAGQRLSAHRLHCTAAQRQG